MSSVEKHNSFSWKARCKSFVYAYRGIKYVVFSQHNMWIHLVLMIFAIGMGFVFEISAPAWIAIVITIAMVLAAEIFNSAIEALVNLVSPEYNEKAGRIKDMAAGAVLITAIAAVIIACIIFIPYIIEF